MKLDIDTCKQCQNCKKKEIINLSYGFLAVYCPGDCKTLSKIMPPVDVIKESAPVKTSENILKIA